jgi:Bacterial protein of unknown function (DUF899)
MNTPAIVSAREWAAAHQQLLVKEKELTRARDALAAMRRRMPWLAVDKEYEFDGPEGRVSLLGLFQGRRQLIVYRAFYGPDIEGWPDHGQLRRRLRRGRMARHQRVHSRRRPGLSHLLRQQPRRRGTGEHLELPRHDGFGPSGKLGGFAGGLSADRAVRVVELARRIWRA